MIHFDTESPKISESACTTVRGTNFFGGSRIHDTTFSVDPLSKRLFVHIFYRFDDKTAKNDRGYRSGSTASFVESMHASGGNSRNESSPVSKMSLPVTALKIQETVYRAEGNANIVIALPQVSRVIF